MKSKLIARSPSTGAATTGGQKPVYRCRHNRRPEARKNRLVNLLQATGYKRPANRGFTLLLAALVSSITLAIGVSIFEITQKQVILSSLSRDSQYAFYTADTGAECALYWDVKKSAFSTSTPITPINCASNADGTPGVINVGHTEPLTSSPVIFTFEFQPGGRCARVSVKKSNTDPRTIIHADGYNTDCASIATNPRALQRSVEIKY